MKSPLNNMHVIPIAEKGGGVLRSVRHLQTIS